MVCFEKNRFKSSVHHITSKSPNIGRKSMVSIAKQCRNDSTQVWKCSFIDLINPYIAVMPQNPSLIHSGLVIFCLQTSQRHIDQHINS